MILTTLFLPMFIDNTFLQPLETTITPHAEDQAIEAYIPHSPILIDDDDGFDDDWPGDGTKDRPFIIEGLHIKSNVYCIKIVGTTSYFIIRDCLLENRDSIIDGKGIVIERVRNGAIEGCKINGMSTGISLLKSQDMTINSCEIAKGKGGVRLEKISSVEVYGCFISNFDYGIYVSKADSSSLTENIIESTTNSIIVDNSITTNVLRNVIQTADQGLSLYSSELLNISSNAVGDVRTSAFVKFTHNSSILDNVIQNGDNGIFLESSNGNDISNNYISAMRSNAVYVIYSWNNIFTSNEIVDNDGVGVYLYDSANCAVYANYIGYNLRGNAYDFVGPATKSHSNKWDDGFGLGNVWGGISTLNPYTVAGDRGSLDRYPIPILTTGNPSDFTVEAGSTSAILWNASAARPHYYQVEQDGIILEEGAWDGKPIDVDIISLDPGIYNYTLLINTTDGREMSHSMQVFSVDTTHPVWILPPVNRAIEHGTRLAMMIEASDLYGISKYWVNDP
ncbi:MAG: right-handed parallel beta-helix repeat-containing protein [Candidatus Thorarchaeota archaeon]